MSIKAKQIAKELNISEAAVSMALNNKKGVSVKLRKKIIDYANAHGYEIKESYSTLENQGVLLFLVYRRSGIVFIDPAFYQQLSLGIDIECKRNHYSLSVHYLFEGENLEEQFKSVLTLDTKGIIVLATEMEESQLSIFKDVNIPLVLLDATFITSKYDSITQNNRQGAYLAIQYLIQNKGEQPGYFCSSVGIHNFRQRKEGFKTTIKRFGYSLNNSEIIPLSPTVEGAYADLLEYLKEHPLKNKCYFADNDMIALGAMKALQEKGIRIPEDVSIIGFDDIPFCEVFSPGLTTIKVFKKELGEMAVHRLMEIIQNPSQQRICTQLYNELVIRGSVTDAAQ